MQITTHDQEEKFISEFKAKDELDGIAMLTKLYRNFNRYKLMLDTVIKNGICVNARDNLGRTLLHLAIIANDSELVKKLITYKANVNLEDDLGQTPLSIAVATFNVKLTRFLLEAGANPKVTTVQDSINHPKDEDLIDNESQQEKILNLPLLNIILSSLDIAKVEDDTAANIVSLLLAYGADSENVCQEFDLDTIEQAGYYNTIAIIRKNNEIAKSKGAGGDKLAQLKERCSNLATAIKDNNEESFEEIYLALIDILASGFAVNVVLDYLNLTIEEISVTNCKKIVTLFKTAFNNLPPKQVAMAKNTEISSGLTSMYANHTQEEESELTEDSNIHNDVKSEQIINVAKDKEIVNDN